MIRTGHIAGNIPTLLRKLTPAEDKLHAAKCSTERAREKPIRATGKGFARLHSGAIVSVSWANDEWCLDPGQSTVRITTKVGERIFASRDEAIDAPTNREFWAL